MPLKLWSQHKRSWRGSNPRPWAHRTHALTTRPQERTHFKTFAKVSIRTVPAITADVPKRLRGWTRNPLGSARAGSSPAVCDFGKVATAGNRTRVESLGGIHHATRPRLLLKDMVLTCHARSGLLMSMFRQNLRKLTSDGIEPPLSDLESEVLPLHHEAGEPRRN